MKRQIIGLIGGPGSGKSYVADLLGQRWGYSLVKMSAPLKDMLRGLGLTEDEIEGDLKEEPCALLSGRTPRYAMQTLGTEWGRELISPTLWADLWRHRLGPLSRIVVDDVRFPNEVELIREEGGLILRVDGRLKTRTNANEAHAAERWESLPYDRRIFNAMNGPADLAGRLSMELGI